MRAHLTRALGNSGIPVSALGLGCWAIGGPFFFDGKPDGWGNVNDQESIRAIQRALDLGITFYDTADVYGTGHSETILGKALGNRRKDAVIATKFGYTYDESTRAITGSNVSPRYIREACARSLQRLNTDYIDLYQLHVGTIPPEEAAALQETLESLCEEGRIRAYGWSTDDPACAALFLVGRHYCAVQHEMNIFCDAQRLTWFCEHNRLASLNRSPLAMGLLSGKFNTSSVLPADDVRGSGHEWVKYFRNGRPAPEFLQRLAGIREILTSNRRTVLQGALAWLWAKSPNTIPIPGFKTCAQVEENAGAISAGPLTQEQMLEIEQIANTAVVGS